jgi:hypothetical protein
MTSDGLLRLLAGGRLVVGGGALVVPRLTGRAFGIDPDANPAAAYVGRLFGARAVLMALLVSAADGEERERQLRVGVAVDLADALAALLAARRKELRPAAAIVAFAAAMTEAAIGMRLVARPAAISAGAVSAGTGPSQP